MKTSKTVIGLMMFMFHSASGNLSISLLACSILGIAFLATGIPAFHTFFIIMVIVMPPYCIITNIASGYVSKYSSKWERLQIAMPIKRKDVIFSQYLCASIASTVGVPIIVIIIGLGIAVHESMSEITADVISSTVSILSISIGIALLLGTFFFPLTCTKISKNRGESLAFICVLAALAIIGLITWLGSSMGLSQHAASLLRIAVSAIFFVFSYVLTKRLYATIDL